MSEAPSDPVAAALAVRDVDECRLLASAERLLAPLIAELRQHDLSTVEPEDPFDLRRAPT